MNETTTAYQPEQATPGKYLTFLLNDETLAVPLMIVREIIALHPITRLPSLPEFVRGVINLRGRIIPIVDLRLRLEQPEVEYDETTCIIVVDADWFSEEDLSPIGCIVDTVDEVLHVTQEDLEPPPQHSADASSRVAMGVAKRGATNSVITLLDMRCVLENLDLSLEALEGQDASATAA